MFKNLSREVLLNLKSKSKIGIIIGLIIAAISGIVFYEADANLTILDRGRLDEPFKE